MPTYQVIKPYREPKPYKTFVGARNALVREATYQRNRARVLHHDDLTRAWDRVLEWLRALDAEGGKVRVPMPTIEGGTIMYSVKVERVG